MALKTIDVTKKFFQRIWTVWPARQRKYHPRSKDTMLVYTWPCLRASFTKCSMYMLLTNGDKELPITIPSFCW
jgi:hypothetical protein